MPFKIFLSPLLSFRRIFIEYNKLSADSAEDAKQIALSLTVKHILQMPAPILVHHPPVKMNFRIACSGFDFSEKKV